MASVAYVVSRGEFSYDDNYYSSTEGGSPNKVFLTEEQAEEYATDQALKEFKELVMNDEIFNYGYGDIDGVFENTDEFDEFCQSKFKMSASDWWDESRKYNPTSSTMDGEEEVVMTDEDWKTFLEFCVLPLYFVSQVEFGDVFS